MEIVITITGLAKSGLVYSDELSTIVDLSKGEIHAMHSFRELLQGWLSVKKYELEDFKKYGKRQ